MPLPSHLYWKLPHTGNLHAPGRAALDSFWSKQGSSKNSTRKATDNLARRGLPAQRPPLSYPLVQPPHFGLEAGRLISRSTFGAPCVCPPHSPSAVPFFFPCPARACPSLLSQRRMLSPTDTVARAPRQSGTLQPRTPKEHLLHCIFSLSFTSVFPTKLWISRLRRINLFTQAPVLGM